MVRLEEMPICSFFSFLSSSFQMLVSIHDYTILYLFTRELRIDIINCKKFKVIIMMSET